MELDDLKAKWKASGDLQPRVEIRQSLERRISEIERSGRGIRTSFLFELMIIFVMYSAFITFVWIFGDRVLGYMYKMVFILGVGFLPALWRLHKAQKWIRSMDYTRDIQSNIRSFLTFYNRTLVIYKWSSYIVIVALLVMLFSDRDFISLSLYFRVGIVVYMAIAMLLTGPYIRVVYGRKTDAFEKFLID